MNEKINLLFIFLNFSINEEKYGIYNYLIKSLKTNIIYARINLINKLFSFNINNKVWFELTMNENRLIYSSDQLKLTS